MSVQAACSSYFTIRPQLNSFRGDSKCRKIVTVLKILSYIPLIYICATALLALIKLFIFCPALLLPILIGVSVSIIFLEIADIGARLAKVKEELERLERERLALGGNHSVV